MTMTTEDMIVTPMYVDRDTISVDGSIAQAGERLRYNNEDYSMASEPLGSYLDTRNDINFVIFSMECWRGYIGSWEIEDNKLYLIGLEAYIGDDDYEEVDDYEKVDLGYVFPDQKKVFADWFTGTIEIPNGKLLKREYDGYQSTFKADLFLEFKEGFLFADYSLLGKNL